MDALLRVKDLAYVQRHARFLIGPGDLLDLSDDGAEGNPHVGHGLRAEHIADHPGGFHTVLIALGRLQLLNQDDALLIHLGKEIPAVSGEQASEHVHG